MEVNGHRFLTVASKRVFWKAFFSLSLLVIRPANAATSIAQQTTLSIAYTSTSPQYSPVWIAKEAGLFKKNGLNVQLVYMRGGVLATQALVSGDVQFINAGGGGVVDAVLGERTSLL